METATQETDCKGQQLIKRVMDYITSKDKYSIGFDYLNGVLSSEKYLPKYELWLWFGEVRIIKKKDRFKEGMTAGKCKVLKDFTINEEGQIDLISE